MLMMIMEVPQVTLDEQDVSGLAARIYFFKFGPVRLKSTLSRSQAGGSRRPPMRKRRPFSCGLRRSNASRANRNLAAPKNCFISAKLVERIVGQIGEAQKSNTRGRWREPRHGGGRSAHLRRRPSREDAISPPGWGSRRSNDPAEAEAWRDLKEGRAHNTPPVGGNYRLVVSFDFRRQVAFVKFIGTHSEYDRVDVLTISQY